MYGYKMQFPSAENKVGQPQTNIRIIKKAKQKVEELIEK